MKNSKIKTYDELFLLCVGEEITYYGALFNRTGLRRPTLKRILPKDLPVGEFFKGVRRCLFLDDLWWDDAYFFEDGVEVKEASEGWFISNIGSALKRKSRVVEGEEFYKYVEQGYIENGSLCIKIEGVRYRVEELFSSLWSANNHSNPTNGMVIMRNPEGNVRVYATLGAFLQATGFSASLVRARIKENKSFHKWSLLAKIP